MVIRLAVFAIASLAGLVLAVFAGIDGRYWGAACFLIAGIAWGLTLALYDIVYGEPGLLLIPLLALATTGFSIADVLSSSKAFNAKLAGAQADFVNILIHADGPYTSLSSSEKKLVVKASITCVVQDKVDVFDFAINAYKAVYFGPALTVVDGINSAMSGPQPVRCLDYYGELRKTKPELFTQFEKDHSWLLAAPAH
ncbi:hypothetical protein ACTUVN_003253 [Pseudomonas caspiana]